MLINQVKKILHQADSVSSASDIPDPWQTSIPVKKTNIVPETWHFDQETEPLIGPAGSPEAPRLVSHQSTSEEILLGDELKLKIPAGSLLKQQLERALTLIYWVKTIEQPNFKRQMLSS